MTVAGSKFHFEELLEKYQIRKTAPRLRVLSMLVSKNVATSQPELENLLSDIDRVTLYRILYLFEEKGLIHKVFDLKGTANYALCSSGCGENHHHDEHLHFNCVNCNNLYCLDKTVSPAFQMPEGFSAEGFTFYAKGLCPKCNKKSAKKSA